MSPMYGSWYTGPAGTGIFWELGLTIEQLPRWGRHRVKHKRVDVLLRRHGEWLAVWMAGRLLEPIEEDRLHFCLQFGFQ